MVLVVIFRYFNFIVLRRRLLLSLLLQACSAVNFLLLLPFATIAGLSLSLSCAALSGYSKTCARWSVRGDRGCG